nr:hypothetical protein [Streptomyces sp. SCL15-6]
MNSTSGWRTSSSRSNRPSRAAAKNAPTTSRCCCRSLADCRTACTFTEEQIGAINLEIALTNFFNRINRIIKEPAGQTWG